MDSLYCTFVFEVARWYIFGGITCRSVVISVVLLVVGQVAVAQNTLTFQQGTSGYAGCVDTVLLHSAPDSDQSGATLLLWDADDFNTPGISPIHPLLRFDDIFGEALGQIPQNVVITEAILYLQVDPIDSGQGVDLHRMLAQWSDLDT